MASFGGSAGLVTSAAVTGLVLRIHAAGTTAYRGCRAGFGVCNALTCGTDLHRATDVIAAAAVCRGYQADAFIAAQRRSGWTFAIPIQAIAPYRASCVTGAAVGDVAERIDALPSAK